MLGFQTGDLARKSHFLPKGKDRAERCFSGKILPPGPQRLWTAGISQKFSQKEGKKGKGVPWGCGEFMLSLRPATGGCP